MGPAWTPLPNCIIVTWLTKLRKGERVALIPSFLEEFFIMADPNTHPRTYLRILGILLLVLSPVAAYGVFHSFSDARDSESWPSAEGSITRSDVTGSSVDGKEKFRADIEYRFSIKDKIYTSTRVRYTDTTGSTQSVAKALVEKYPLYSKHKVFYCPDDPMKSVLEPGGGDRGYLLLLVPVLLFGIGVWLIRLSKQRKNTAPDSFQLNSKLKSL
jgi:hypothetical protein